jgi:hypothetical protein
MKTKIDSAAGVATYQHVRGSFARQGLMKHLGAELTALRSGQCEIRVASRRADTAAWILSWGRDRLLS